MEITLSAVVIIGLVSMWFLQLGMSYLQMKRFYGRVSELRRQGRVSIGMEGGMYRGRQYGVLCVDSRDVIKHAEQLSGFTVFASLKPVPELVGKPMRVLFEDDGAERLGVKPKQFKAFRHAAQFILDAEEKAKAKAQGADDPEAVSEHATA